MRDEMDARIWVAHHDRLSSSVDAALAAVGNGLGRRQRSLNRLPGQLLSLAAAMALTSLTFNQTIA